MKAKLVEYGQLVYRLGLVWGTSGNMSLRLDKDYFIITASGSSLRDLLKSDIVKCSLDPEGGWQGEKPPSMEFRMHREIYRLRGDVKAILHAQPLYSTLVACAPEIELKREIIPESIAYLKRIERVPYHHPGSMDLAKEAGQRSLKADILLLENHGILCMGTSLEEVVNKAETLEFLARLTIIGRNSKVELKTLPKEIVNDFEQSLKERVLFLQAQNSKSG